MWLLPLALLALAPLSSGDITLWYTRPASDQREAVAVTNGRLAATVFGGVGEECIQINQDPDGGPLADLLLTFNHEEKVFDYARSLNPRTAVAAVSYKAGNVRYKREIFSTAVDSVVIVRLETDTEGALSFESALTSPHLHSVKCPRSNHLMLHAQTDSPELQLEAWLVVLAEGGTTQSGGGKITVQGAHAATLVMASGIGQDHAFICRKTMGAAVRKPYSQLLEEHLAKTAGLIEPD